MTEIKQKTDIPTWNNLTNQLNFYQKIPVLELLKQYAVEGGLESGADIDRAWNYIKNASTILEVGAGYGRVIKCLLARGYKGQITAVEHSEHMFKYMEENYRNKVNLFRENIVDFCHSEKFDTILWLWSGISDFTKEEQPAVMEKLFGLLQSGGTLIMDTFPCSAVPSNAITANNQTYTMKAMDCIASGYIPSPLEIKDYADHTGLVSVKPMEYVTSTNRKRMLYIFTKPKASLE